MTVKGKNLILGLGAPIVDLLLFVSQDFWDSVEGEPGGSQPITFAEMQTLIERSGAQPLSVPGGSTANTLRGLAAFGFSCAQLGMVGRDAEGQALRTALFRAGIRPIFWEDSHPTSRVLCLVSPTGERTMRSCLGASQYMRPHHLTVEPFTLARHLHVEGYALYAAGTAQRAAELAQNHGLSISLDLGSFEVVRQFEAELSDLLDEYADVVFGNEDEVEALLGVRGEEACDALAEQCEVAVVMMGDRGAWVRRGGEKFHCPAQPVAHPRDTTGAGDLFAAGFLAGYLAPISLRRSADLGVRTAAAVIQEKGGVIPEGRWEELRRLAL
jgi:sugar/nucleoside kinase (ribokinase family)